MFQSGGRGRVLPLSFSCMHQTNFSLKFFSYFFVFPRVRFCLLSLGNCGRCQCIMFLQCLHKCCCSCAVCSVNTAWCLKYLFGFFFVIRYHHSCDADFKISSQFVSSCLLQWKRVDSILVSKV